MASDKEWLEQHGVTKEKKFIKRERGIWLTIYLGIDLIGAGWLMIMLPLAFSRASNNEIEISTGSVLLLGLADIAYIVSIMGIWNWRRWGVYSFVVLTIVSPFIMGALGISTWSLYIGLFVQLTIMWVLLRKNMQLFD